MKNIIRVFDSIRGSTHFRQILTQLGAQAKSNDEFHLPSGWTYRGANGNSNYQAMILDEKKNVRARVWAKLNFDDCHYRISVHEEFEYKRRSEEEIGILVYQYRNKLEQVSVAKQYREMMEEMPFYFHHLNVDELKHEADELYNNIDPTSREKFNINPPDYFL